MKRRTQLPLLTIVLALALATTGCSKAETPAVSIAGSDTPSQSEPGKESPTAGKDYVLSTMKVGFKGYPDAKDTSVANYDFTVDFGDSAIFGFLGATFNLNLPVNLLEYPSFLTDTANTGQYAITAKDGAESDDKLTFDISKTLIGSNFKHEDSPTADRIEHLVEIETDEDIVVELDSSFTPTETYSEDKSTKIVGVKYKTTETDVYEGKPEIIIRNCFAYLVQDIETGLLSVIRFRAEGANSIAYVEQFQKGAAFTPILE